ncbi:heavy metal efflux pump, CzcA family [Rubritalea squalenifaciens DSM 18772]|uniref:Heavy metal efflux pump, CzcA family n=1 Tax=Rubritalea squalenifaciens DSM 18772 TaxID=1123071 RepID=A0A1M6INN5_9BACT|nr:efflux RND transporter permease subunit [Rubritalea squalenifaciens]SHJ35969.1 heavy metal efflux pump, CzcA family [Rubritalea squalenifaciens DSM 18772]
MLNKLIRLSLAHRALVIAAALLIIGLGFMQTRKLPVEVLPDLTKPTVTILTEAPGLAPEEVEQRITVPLERALIGVNGVTRVRSKSDVALSLVFVEFEWDTDIYKARQFVQERMQTVEMAEGITPYMTPVASLMGEIMLVGLTSDNPDISPSDLRTYADWTVRRQLQSQPGIAEVLSMGGGIKQIQIQPDPNKLLSHGVTFTELREAASQAASTSTGGFVSSDSKEVMIRNLAMTTDLDQIGKTVVKDIDDRPVTIADVAEVKWGIEPMRGDAAVDGKAGVIMSVTKSPGFDTIKLTEKVEEMLEELQRQAPEGVTLKPLFRQQSFIDLAIDNLKEAIRDGAIMVIVILFLFLFNIRTTLITLTAIPLSFAITAIVFSAAELSVNSMTLGGIAVAIGIVVDDAIVDVENVFRRLRENASSLNPKPRLEVIANASGEVRNSILYATLFIILVFVPLLSLSGVEGRLFTPIAIATMVSMGASFVVSLTVIPVLCSLFLRPKAGKEHKDGFLVHGMKWLFTKTFLFLSLRTPALVVAVALMLLTAAALLYPMLGKEFLPEFKEETVVVATAATPGTSLQQTSQISHAIDKALLELPDVASVGHRVGRAERGDHVVPVSTVEFDIELKKSDRPRSEVIKDIAETVNAKNFPGTFSVVSGPLKDRIGHMLSGVPAKVAVKVYGPDLDTIREIGTKIQEICMQIPGLETAKVEQQAPIPQLRIEVDRDRAKAYGFRPDQINDHLSALLDGEHAALLYEGERTIDLVVRLPESWRESPDKLGEIMLTNDHGQRVPLKVIADLRSAKGPNVIVRENTERRFVVSINPSERDLQGMITELDKQIDEQIRNNPEYKNNRVEIEGEYQAQQEASKRIGIAAGVVLLIIALLLYTYFGTATFALQVICDIPLALIGGLVFTWMTINNISIATLVGFIAVAGIAARNSIMLISHYLHLMKHEGEGFTKEMIIRGTQERLVPVLMTALSAGLALIPLVTAGEDPGKEILHPVAIVITGGLVSSTFLGLAVTPAVFYLFGRRAAEKSISINAPAAG